MGIADRDYMKAGFNPRAPRRRRHRSFLMRLIVAAGLGIASLLFWWKPNPQEWPGWIRSQVQRNVDPVKNERIVVDANTATLWELRTIPGVNESVAKGIIKGRPYSNIEELDAVYGVGPVTMTALRKHVVIATNKPAIKKL